jgi:copper chaperone NosL
MSRILLAAAMLLALVLQAGCGRGNTPPPAPPPAEVTGEAVGRYCGMRLVDHEGPKGQVHLTGAKQPVWFSSVRDTLAFMRLPEEPRDIAAVYVNDMARSRHWDQPDAGAWIDPRQAWFVIESDMRGGMGAPEAVPFSNAAAAQAFQAAHKGKVVRLADIPDAYVLGPVDIGGSAAHHMEGGSAAHHMEGGHAAPASGSSR